MLQQSKEVQILPTLRAIFSPRCLLPAHSVMHDLWDLYSFSLLLFLPRATSLLLSWMVYMKGFVICFYTSIEKQNRMAVLAISETLKPIYSNPNVLMDRNLRFQGDIDVCKAKWEESLESSSWLKANLSPLWTDNSEITPTLGLALLKLSK